MAGSQTRHLALWLVLVAGIGQAAGLKCYSCNYTSFLPDSPGNNPDCLPDQFSPTRLDIAEGPSSYYCTKGSSSMTIQGGLQLTMYSRFLTPDDSSVTYYVSPVFCQTDLCNGEGLPPTTSSPATVAYPSGGLTTSPNLGLLSLLLSCSLSLLSKLLCSS